MPALTCSVDECGREALHRGWCNRHYLRWQRTGDPLGSQRLTLEERFWAKVDRRSEDDCWQWMAGLTTGYGSFGIGGPDGYRMHLAHRVAYEMLVGPIPSGLTLDHLCHTRDETCPGGECRHRRCVNPAHLEPVDLDENKSRGRSGPAQNARKTACPEGHPYSVTSRNGWRRCRRCDQANQREMRRRKRELLAG